MLKQIFKEKRVSRYFIITLLLMLTVIVLVYLTNSRVNLAWQTDAPEINISQDARLKVSSNHLVKRWDWYYSQATEPSCNQSTKFNSSSTNQKIAVFVGNDYVGHWYCFKVTSTENKTNYLKYQIISFSPYITVYQDDLTLRVSTEINTPRWRWFRYSAKTTCDDKLAANRFNQPAIGQDYTSKTFVIKMKSDYINQYYCFKLLYQSQSYYYQYQVKPIQIIKVSQRGLQLNATGPNDLQGWNWRRTADPNLVCDQQTSSDFYNSSQWGYPQLVINIPSDAVGQWYCFRILGSDGVYYYRKYQVKTIETPILISQNELRLDVSTNLNPFVWEWVNLGRNSGLVCDDSVVYNGRLPLFDNEVVPTDFSIYLEPDFNQNEYCFKLTDNNQQIYYRKYNVGSIINVKFEQTEDQLKFTSSVAVKTYRWAKDFSNFECNSEGINSKNPTTVNNTKSITVSLGANSVDDFYCVEMTDSSNQVRYYKYRVKPGIVIVVDKNNQKLKISSLGQVYLWEWRRFEDWDLPCNVNSKFNATAKTQKLILNFKSNFDGYHYCFKMTDNSANKRTIYREFQLNLD